MGDTFGAVVRAERERRGLTLQQLGERIGVDHARMSRLELGRVRPTAREVHAVARELELNANEILPLAAAVEPVSGQDLGPEL